MPVIFEQTVNSQVNINVITILIFTRQRTILGAALASARDENLNDNLIILTRRLKNLRLFLPLLLGENAHVQNINLNVHCFVQSLSDNVNLLLVIASIIVSIITCQRTILRSAPALNVKT